MRYDAVIIGGGAAGMMAALSVKRHHPDFSVALIDRTFALGRKILVSGAGRCNITNHNLSYQPEKHYYGAESSFFSNIFSQFDYESIVKFFDELGIELYLERKTDIGKLFPTTDQAKTVTLLLEDELHRKGVEVILNTECEKIRKLPEVFEVQCTSLATQERFILTSRYVILSAGGKTYPALGSNGTGYTLAESLGHTIITPVPSALPLVGKNPLSQEANGLKMEIEVWSEIDGKKIKSSTNDVMFTQYGLSGPAILNISREISIFLHRDHGSSACVYLNFFPGKSKGQVKEFFMDRWSRRPDQSIEMSLNGIFAPKFPPVFLKAISIPPQTEVTSLSESQIQQLLDSLSGYKIVITDTRGWNEAEFTAGGVDTKEVDSITLQSTKVKKLYICGEILDVDGDVGGFNLSWAWSSGFVAGKLLS